MATLTILQRNGSDLALLTTTDDAAELASRLASMQPFDVEVFAEFPGKSAFLPVARGMLEAQHHANGWYAASPAAVAQAVCRAFVVPPGRGGVSHASDKEVPQKVTSQGIDPSWHALLEPCPREDADKATVIRRTLKSVLGRWQAEAILSAYKETILRIGPCGRYFKNGKGETLRLAASVRREPRNATKPSALQ